MPGYIPIAGGRGRRGGRLSTKVSLGMKLIEGSAAGGDKTVPLLGPEHKPRHWEVSTVKLGSMHLPQWRSTSAKPTESLQEAHKAALTRSSIRRRSTGAVTARTRSSMAAAGESSPHIDLDTLQPRKVASAKRPRSDVESLSAQEAEGDQDLQTPAAKRSRASESGAENEESDTGNNDSDFGAESEQGGAEVQDGAADDSNNSAQEESAV